MRARASGDASEGGREQRIVRSWNRARCAVNRGITVIPISYRLTDVFAVTDRIVVLRQGRVETQLATAETDTSDVVAYIVGAK